MKKLTLSICLLFLSAVGYSQWTALNSGTTNDLLAIYFSDASTGYAVGLW